MITIKTGDILRQEADALVNTVNCVGVMGRGIALQFKKAYPENYRAYAAACRRDEVRPGQMFVTETGRPSPRFIINFPTKRHWRSKSRVNDIESGLEDLAREIRRRRIRSIAIPALGSGLGGLQWQDVRPLIENAMADLEEVDVVVFEPGYAPSGRAAVGTPGHSAAPPKMTAGRAALIGLMNRYVSGLIDPFVTLLEVHKLMYFMQCAGEPLRLRFAKGHYGPYAENLRHVLTRLEGYMISGYADGGDIPHKQLEVMPGALEKASRFLESREPTRERFERVGDLVEGFESPFGLELLSTVHWVIAQDQNELSADRLAEKVHSWNPGKRKMTARQIKLAASVLEEKGWLDAAAR